uniref:Uncharacterized protein n=1 Tax=Lepeophtheirus salmonis TaxID=72036 RepID=A0A0K2UPP0_LEPSM
MTTLPPLRVQAKHHFFRQIGPFYQIVYPLRMQLNRVTNCNLSLKAFLACVFIILHIQRRVIRLFNKKLMTCLNVGIYQ